MKLFVGESCTGSHAEVGRKVNKIYHNLNAFIWDGTFFFCFSGLGEIEKLLQSGIGFGALMSEERVFFL